MFAKKGGSCVSRPFIPAITIYNIKYVTLASSNIINLLSWPWIIRQPAIFHTKCTLYKCNHIVFIFLSSVDYNEMVTVQYWNIVQAISRKLVVHISLTWKLSGVRTGIGWDMDDHDYFPRPRDFAWIMPVGVETDFGLFVSTWNKSDLSIICHHSIFSTGCTFSVEEFEYQMFLWSMDMCGTSKAFFS